MIFSTTPARSRGYRGYGSFGADPGEGAWDSTGTLNVTPDLNPSGTDIDTGSDIGTGGSFWDSLPGILNAGGGILKTVLPGSSTPVSTRPPVARSPGAGMMSGAGSATTIALVGGGLLLAMMLMKKR